MPRRALATLAAAALVATTATVAWAGKVPDVGAEDVHARPTVEPAPVLEEAYRFTSFPDFLNQDVADVTHLPGYRGPADGSANGTNASYERSIGFVLDEIAAFDPEAFLVAGDLVEGSWGLDRSGSGVFGRVRGTANRVAAVGLAAQTYYEAWLERVVTRGLTPYAAVGDHEIGDNPWRVGGRSRNTGWIDFKREHLDVWKDAFSRHVVERTRAASTARTSAPSAIGTVGGVSHPVAGQAAGTAYAVRLDPRVLLVSLDEFRLNESGGKVVTSLDPDQLAWLSGVLAEARRLDVPWVVVQGHLPIVTPVRTRRSSRLAYDEGRGSALWQLMVEHRVDLYLSGEVHDHTAVTVDGITQVSHGALLYAGEASYVNGQVSQDRLVLETRQLRGKPRWRSGQLWSTEGGNGPLRIDYRDPSRVVGTLVLERDPADPSRNVVTQATGIDRDYRP